MNLQAGANQDLQISPERLNDSGAYSKDNVKFICAELNVGKTENHKILEKKCNREIQKKHYNT